MAVFPNTFTTTGTGGSNPPVGNRQEIDDIVSRITPEDTPIYSMIGKEKTKSTSPEWETDTLRAPAANAQLEGDEYAFTAISPALRMKNYTQILRQGWIVSNTQEAVSNVGNAEKFAEKKIKSGIEVRKDIELSILSNAASTAGSTRVSGGLPTWLVTNVSRNTSGVNGGYNVGTGLTVAETPAPSKRAFTKALMDTVMGMVYTSGGNTRSMVCSPYIKSVFVTFMSDPAVAPFRYAVSGSKNTIVGTADAYAGPYGEINVIPDRVMAAGGEATARRVYFIDPDLLAWKSLRPIQEDPDLAKTGDARKGMIIGEGTLKVANEAGLGVVADVYGINAST